MIYAGCDVGSLTAKAVIFKDGMILGKKVILAEASPVESAEKVMDAALKEAGISWDDIIYMVSTGYGKDQIPFANSSRSEIACHARGAWWCMPSARTVIDIGGQDAKAIRLDENGKVVNYRYNDKCATGTGRFLEVMAKTMEVELGDMGSIAEKSTKRLSLSNQCVVFAETEVVSLINEGEAIPDIIGGLNRSLSGRVAALAKSIGIEDDIVFTGGVAKNIGVFRSLERALNCTLKPLNGNDPQLNGALGAALLAKEMFESGGKK
jgi:(R)-2-hydroxyacyl-CoA dehydratese activating ATPase